MNVKRLVSSCLPRALATLRGVFLQMTSRSLPTNPVEVCFVVLTGITRLLLLRTTKAGMLNPPRLLAKLALENVPTSLRAPPRLLSTFRSY